MLPFAPLLLLIPACRIPECTCSDTCAPPPDTAGAHDTSTGPHTGDTGPVLDPEGDEDGDGWVNGQDCAPLDPDAYPERPDSWYDGVDADCMGDDDYDADGDGHVGDEAVGLETRYADGSGSLPGGDCWDDPLRLPLAMAVMTGQDATGAPLSWPQPGAAAVHPGAPDAWYDGVDADCAGNGDFDADGDGHETSDYPSATGFGTDCVDDPATDRGLTTGTGALPAAQVHPGATDAWYDGTDADCDGNDCDRDGDGHAFPASVWCAAEDCDDSNPTRYADPTVTPTWYNGVDEACTGNDGDQDGDRYWDVTYAERVGAAGGSPLAIPSGAEGDCADDPAGHVDAPLNGLPALLPADVNPGEMETWYDGLDADCAGGDDFDADADGHRTEDWPDAVGALGDDCDDAEALRSPAIPEVDDDLDNDCDDSVDEGFRTFGDLVITEVMHNPWGSTGYDPQNAYIEIHNPDPARDLHLDGMEVYVSTDEGYAFVVGDGGLVVPAGGYAVLCGRPNARTLMDACSYTWSDDVNGVSEAGDTFNPGLWLDHNSATLRLRLGGVVLDAITWDTAAGWPPNVDGASMELSTLHLDATDNDVPTAWCLATTRTSSTERGTPGEANDCTAP